jgi:aspartyl-tRNA synthetase
MTRLTSYSETDPEFKIGYGAPPAIFTRFGTQRFALLLALKGALRDVTSYRKGSKRGGA